jgi:hypothetical protein
MLNFTSTSLDTFGKADQKVTRETRLFAPKTENHVNRGIFEAKNCRIAEEWANFWSKATDILSCHPLFSTTSWDRPSFLTSLF